ncbi:hypothetical protein QOZ80_3AG0246980 [Eleusine coracana subsp. coracana]|nr:hypothetical protein QOZ80_3AG0246980 [Eleusine coracana subsp. coracana]
MDPMFGKYFESNSQQSPIFQPQNHQPIPQPTTIHKSLPKLGFPKFLGEKPKIWRRKCEVYFDVFSIPESLCMRFATLNFVEKAALWLETVELNGRIEEWDGLCDRVMKRWGREQHQVFMRQILSLR